MCDIYWNIAVVIVKNIDTIAVTVASVVAVYGINAWKKEYVGKRKIELAEEVLTLFYEAEDAIRGIRNPFSRAGEGTSRERSADESDAEAEAFNQAYVVIERYNSYKELFSKISSKRYRFKAIFGTDSSKPFDDMILTVNRILSKTTVLANYWKRLKNDMLDEKTREGLLETLKDHEAVIWEDYVKPDPITQKVKNIIKEVEDICRPIIQGAK